MTRDWVGVFFDLRCGDRVVAPSAAFVESSLPKPYRKYPRFKDISAKIIEVIQCVIECNGGNGVVLWLPRTPHVSDSCDLGFSYYLRNIDKPESVRNTFFEARLHNVELLTSKAVQK